MPQAKLDALPVPLSTDNPGFLLRLELQKEVDRLAVLLEEVKKQSEKVQAVADAIGDKCIFEQLQGVSVPPRKNGGHAPPKTNGRK